MEADNIAYTDLLIVGAGPAGLMAAAWASRYNISARIIDKKNARVSRGHADGLQSRTLEILDSFGSADRILKEGFHDIEICSWDSVGDHGIRRAQKVPSQKVGVSRFPQIILHQGYIEQTILDFIEGNGGPRVERCTVPKEVSLDHAFVDQRDSHPITIKLECYGSEEIPTRVNGHAASTSHVREQKSKRNTKESVNGHEAKVQSQLNHNGNKAFKNNCKINLMEAENGPFNGIITENCGQPVEALSKKTNGAVDYTDDTPLKPTTVETSELERTTEVIKAKYLLGCDGAHSWIRQRFGIPLEGSQTHNVWGVIDIIPLTDFPDIRQTCVIRSATHGSILIIPREGKLVRLYVQLNEMSGKERNSAPLEITPAVILEVARKIVKPYTLDFKYLDWWSKYKIQQRVASQFSIANRIFLAGDAVHTHSPKLGQGMNVSMQDTYNLGWKICSVINGTAREEILSTYGTERRQIALDLIAADHKIAHYCSQRSFEDLTHNSDYTSLRESLHEFLSGAAVNYGPSILTWKRDPAPKIDDVIRKESVLAETSPLASKLNIGMRLPSYKVINHADARCVQLGELLQSDGRWRILNFAGDLTDACQYRRVQLFGEFLAAPGSIIRKYTPLHEPLDSVIEVLTIHSGPRVAVPLLSLHDTFHPYDEITGWDYWKVFVDEPSLHEGFGDVYGKFGIDKRRGCLVVCRPDQHTGCVLDLEDFMALNRYFEKILVPVA